MTSSLKTGDVNKDGILDIAEGNSEQPNYVYLGKSDGTFIEMELGKALKDDTYDIDIADLNKDGFPDIIESNSGELNLIYMTRKQPDR